MQEVLFDTTLYCSFWYWWHIWHQVWQAGEMQSSFQVVNWPHCTLHLTSHFTHLIPLQCGWIHQTLMLTFVSTLTLSSKLNQNYNTNLKGSVKSRQVVVAVV